MKANRILFFLIFFLFNGLMLNAQDKIEKRATLKFGLGSFLDIFNADFKEITKDPYTGLEADRLPTGTAIWIEGGYKLENNIIISANILFAFVNSEYLDVLYQGSTYIERTQNYTVNFSYEFGKSSKHKFIPGIGILYNIWTTSKAQYIINQTTNGDLILSDFAVSSSSDSELGINLNLDYHYQFKNNFFVGARINTVYLISVASFESIVLSPIIGVKF